MRTGKYGYTMGPAEKQAISAQHRVRNNHEKKTPGFINCAEWRNVAFKNMLQHGVKIQYYTDAEQQLNFIITYPGEEPMYVPQSEIQADYERACDRKRNGNPIPN